MAVEAFVWFYENGEPKPLSVSAVLGAFEGAIARWAPETGHLRLDFGNSADTCDVYLDPAAAQQGETRGLLISRPILAAELWEPILRLMSAHNGLLFFSDETTPVVCDWAALAHFPKDLIGELGGPAKVQCANDLLRGRSTAAS